MTFFALGGFLVLEDMEREQRQLDDEEDDNDNDVTGHVEEVEEDSESEEEEHLTDDSFDAKVEGSKKSLKDPASKSQESRLSKSLQTT